MMSTSYIYKKIISNRFIFPVWSKFGQQKIRVLNYHNIAPGLTITPEIIERQLKLIAKNFETYYASDAPAILNGEIRPKKVPVILTFDDGFKNNSRYAFSHIEKLGLKATLYLPIGVLKSDERYLWNHIVRIKLENAPNDLLASISQRWGRQNTDKFKAINDCCEFLKTQPETLRLKEIEHLNEFIPEFIPTKEQKDKYQLMTIDECQRLPSCIEIGSHTVNHKILTNLQLDEVETEVKNSKEELEKIFNRDIETFCYPNGNWNEAIRDIVSQQYKAGFTTMEGLADRKDNYMSLKRIPAHNKFSLFKYSLIRPYIDGTRDEK